MNPLHYPWHLILPASICVLGISLMLWKSRSVLIESKRKWVWRALFIFFTGYLLILAPAIYRDILIQLELNSFDLNGDGSFDASEKSLQQQEAMLRLTRETGRNFAVFTGAIFGFILGLMTYVIGKLFERLRTNKLR